MYCNPSNPAAVQAPGFSMMAPPGLLLQHPRSSTRVSFRDTRMEVRVVSLACLSDDLRRDIWYSPSDIDSMRSEARDLCRFLRVNPQACPEEHVRGLELRISLERQCRKQMTVQGVVEAQRRCTDPAFLACLSQRCSIVPMEMALAQARRDYCNVYAVMDPVAQAPPPYYSNPNPVWANFGPPPFLAQTNHHHYHDNHQGMAMMGHPMFATAAMPPRMHHHPASTQDHVDCRLFAPTAAAAAPLQRQPCGPENTAYSDFDCCSLEPIPLSPALDNPSSWQGETLKRTMTTLMDDNQERIVRRRFDGYPAG